ncbi:26S proteasome non-ATPase regulatory subunit 14-like [Hylaeus volcanicus]|uniref:26S proteasome non-ATPase regulatory subunit 14-like n=1 Tax=Hylaeus volcanicus TaxID=313075 RepID=UPI0023B83F51|nr:26S proteasome non-ATPase regulatory subunit 14-like [Hylaeus volcanicus]
MAGFPQNIRQILGQVRDMGINGNNVDPLASIDDTSEQVYVSSLSLLKMLRHGRAGIPMEVMGLMLGEFIDEYTIRVVDVFSMPQSGNTVSVEAVDPAYQAEMLEMLKRTGRPEVVVGWYHSHPGFGCWFSGTDVNTQQSFERLNRRAVGVVVDPIQSVKGKVVIDCFRLINPHSLVTVPEPRQTTSNIGHLQKPTITALVHGLNRHYYSLVISYRKGDFEEEMLLNFNKSSWIQSLTVLPFTEQKKEQETCLSTLKDLTKRYITEVEEMQTHSKQSNIPKVGKLDAKKHLQSAVNDLLMNSLMQTFTAMIGAKIF